MGPEASKTSPNSENIFEVNAFDPEGDEVFLNWSVQAGTLDPAYNIANWLLPPAAGFYNIFGRVY